MNNKNRVLSLILALTIAVSFLGFGTSAFAGIAETFDGIHNTLDFSRTDCTNAVVKLSKTKYKYNGKIKAPSAKVTVNETELTKGIDYKVIYSENRKNVGTYKVTIKFIGNCEGKDKIAKFSVVPATTSIGSITAKKKAFTVKYRKIAKQASGYEIQYSTKKNYSEAKTKTVNKASTISKTVKGLKSGKKYYVRVRAYKTVNGKKVYGNWSKTKTVKIK